MTGRCTKALVFAGKVPAAVPSATLYHAGTVTIWLVLLVTNPQCGVALPVFSMIAICCPIAVPLDGVRTVPVTVPVVALPAVNGVPVESESAVTAGNVLP